MAGLKLYRAYNFRGKSPSIDLIRTVFEDDFGERITRKHLREIEKAGGPSVSCMAGWFFGKTMRPTDTTMEAAGRARGYERVWKKMNGKSPKR